MKLNAEIKENMRNYNDFKKQFHKLVGNKDILAGIFAGESGTELVKIATAHEYGAKINHPGGTPYIINPLGEATFVGKNSAQIHGYTKPHIIKIPQRSFLRSTLKENKVKIKLLFAKAYNDILHNNISIKNAFDDVGKAFTQMVKRKIRGKIPPPLKPATIRRKSRSLRRDTPLIDTGFLINSITHRLEL